MVLSGGKSTGCLATFIERKTRLYTAIKIKNRTAEAMEKIIKRFFKVLPLGAFKSLTVNRVKNLDFIKT